MVREKIVERQAKNEHKIGIPQEKSKMRDKN